jgi:hypothetical protein
VLEDFPIPKFGRSQFNPASPEIAFTAVLEIETRIDGLRDGQTVEVLIVLDRGQYSLTKFVTVGKVPL